MATALIDGLETAGVEGYTVDNDGRSAADVAAEVLRAIGWSTTPATGVG